MIDAQKVKELFVNIMELEEFISEDEGDIIDLSDFTKCAEEHSIMDYDGFGYILYKDIITNSLKQISNACLCVDEQMIYLCDETDAVVGFNLYMMYDMFGNNIKILWFNK